MTSSRTTNMQLGLSYSFLIIVYFSPLLGSKSCQNCKGEKCDTRGICTEGCKTGYTDKYCQHHCQETCVNLTCEVDPNSGKTICSDGCEDGYCGPRCKIPCPDGCLACDWYHCENCTLCRADLYGSKCEYSCLQKCQGFACSVEETCLEECIAGRYGAQCNMSCLSVFQSCHRFTGQCQHCQPGHFGDKCQHLCPSCLTAEEETFYTCRSGCKVCSSQSYPESQQYSFKMQDRQETLLAILYTVLVILIINNVMFIALVAVCCCRGGRSKWAPGTNFEMEKRVEAFNDPSETEHLCRGTEETCAPRGPVTGKKADSQAWIQVEARRPGPTQKSDVPDNDLRAACREGKLGEVKRILDTGRADVNCRGVDGRTLVMAAAQWRHRDVVELLVSRRADVSLVDDGGNNILHYACYGGDRKTVEFVLSLDGVDINSRGERSWTPVMEAAVGRHGDVVELLVSRGADVSLVDDDGDNTLHYACGGGDRKTVEFVLSLDWVDINARNNDGKTAADVARDRQHHQLSDLLVSRGTQ
ncbi:uncharacterized protein LOC124256650 isoform X2 [Haliotis rubra]|uniref:uncharacterized protein LOC124256650 isoform X2 n=1 Tax=Haliotis rubra TaxID=36100 RepID=UPI001EE521FB|nr:uncharacterized protein LOC124256650 isoform X2 [Haliotis rubra]